MKPKNKKMGQTKNKMSNKMKTITNEISDKFVELLMEKLDFIIFLK